MPVVPLWFVCALASAIVWGFSYALSEKILKGALPPTFYMACTGFVYFTTAVALAAWQGNIKSGLETLASDKGVLFLTLLTALCYVAGALLIYISISLKNATLANVVEITYPLFTLLFAYILYREIQVNLWTGLGTFLILSGISLIYLKS